MKKQDRLTELVIEYKKTNNEKLLKEIGTLSEGLIYHICKYYGICNFPTMPLDEIILDCKHLILIRSITAFDITRGAKFSTFYTWRLKSHIRFRKEFYMKRKDIFNSDSLDEALYNDGNSMNFGDVFSTASTQVFGRVRKELATMFV